MIIYTKNEQPKMQSKKLNAKYHLHVQHSTDVRTLKLLHQGYKIQQGHKIVLKIMKTVKLFYNYFMLALISCLIWL